MKKSVSVIIPAYKEEETIEKVINGILSEFQNEFDFEIIVVIDTAPQDRTFDIVNNMSKQFPQIKIIMNEKKRGVGKAIIDGIERATKDTTIIVMADDSEKSSDLRKLVLKMNEGHDMVFANRFMHHAILDNYPKNKYFFNRLCNFTIRLLFKIPSNDITNAVKVYKSEILKDMNPTSDGFEIFAELPIRAYVNGYRNIAEVATNHNAGKKEKSKFSIFNEGPKYVKMMLSCLGIMT